MKKKTHTILLALYDPTQQPEENSYLSYQFLYDVFPEYSESGLRSIVTLLSSQKYITKLLRNNQTYLALSAIGKLKVLERYPALAQKPQKASKTAYSVCCCYDAPKHDPQFRKLRFTLLSYKARSIMRGVYVLNYDPLPQDLFRVLLDKYSSSVMVFTIKEFSLGELAQISSRTNSDPNYHKSLSEASSKLSSMLATHAVNNDAKYREKSYFLNLFPLIESSLAAESLNPPDLKNTFIESSRVFAQWSVIARMLYFHATT